MGRSKCSVTDETFDAAEPLGMLEGGVRYLHVHAYISTFLQQPRQSLHQVCDKDDVHDVSEVRRPAGEGHQLLA